MLPKYPVYVISKGRWDSRLTSKSLEKIGCPYRIVIEPQEYDEYAAVIDPEKILVLPFSNLGQGSIPARNWVWQHAKDEGHGRHWILDDNIRDFYRYNRNLKIPVASPTIFRAAEEFTDRYENVPMSGMQYYMFIVRRAGRITPFYLNTRVYSCILLDHWALDEALEERWRGRYNEDTDLSIRVLKAGFATVLFNAFLADKETTMTMGGGNTDELYADDGRLQMAQSLVDQHPDIVRVSWKWGRHQHHVDYSGFKKTKLIRKSNVEIPEGVNEFGMVFQRRLAGEDTWQPMDTAVDAQQRLRGEALG